MKMLHCASRFHVVHPSLCLKYDGGWSVRHTILFLISSFSDSFHSNFKLLSGYLFWQLGQDFQQILSYSDSFYTSLCALMGKHVRVFYLSIWREVVRPLTVFPIQITVLFTCISGFKLFVTRSGFRPLSSDTELQIPLQRFRWHVISLRDLFDCLWHVSFMRGREECWSFMHQRQFSLLALHSLAVPQDVITRCPQPTTLTQWVWWWW